MPQRGAPMSGTVLPYNQMPALYCSFGDGDSVVVIEKGGVVLVAGGSGLGSHGWAVHRC